MQCPASSTASSCYISFDVVHFFHLISSLLLLYRMHSKRCDCYSIWSFFSSWIFYSVCFWGFFFFFLFLVFFTKVRFERGLFHWHWHFSLFIWIRWTKSRIFNFVAVNAFNVSVKCSIFCFSIVSFNLGWFSIKNRHFYIKSHALWNFNILNENLIRNSFNWNIVHSSHGTCTHIYSQIECDIGFESHYELFILFSKSNGKQSEKQINI